MLLFYEGVAPSPSTILGATDLLVSVKISCTFFYTSTMAYRNKCLCEVNFAQESEALEKAVVATYFLKHSESAIFRFEA